MKLVFLGTSCMTPTKERNHRVGVHILYYIEYYVLRLFLLLTILFRSALVLDLKSIQNLTVQNCKRKLVLAK